ncbi:MULTISPECIES: hypothetical protein [unclassified Microcoleus]
MFNLRIETVPSTLTLHLLEQISPATYINPEDDRTFRKLLRLRLK